MCLLSKGITGILFYDRSSSRASVGPTHTLALSSGAGSRVEAKDHRRHGNAPLCQTIRHPTN